MSQGSDAAGNLYGAMRFLMMHAARAEEPESAEPRNVVSKRDALDAILQVAARIDAAFEGDDVPRDEWIAAGAMLMVVREYVEPLPPAVDSSGRDVVAEGLSEYLDAFRSTHAPDTVPDDLA